MSARLAGSDFLYYVIIFLVVTTFLVTFEYKKILFRYRQRSRRGLQRKIINYKLLNKLSIQCCVISVYSLAMIYLLPEYYTRIYAAPVYIQFVVVYLGLLGKTMYDLIKSRNTIMIVFKER